MRVRALLASVVVVAACGGEGIEAPHTIGADEDTGCPSADEALSHTKAAFHSDAMNDLRPVLTRVLVDEGGLRVLLQAASLILDDTSSTTFSRLLEGLDPAKGLGGLTPHIVDVLQYINGTSPYVDGPHEEPVAALHSVLTTCDAAQTLSTLRVLLELEVSTDADGKPVLVERGQGDRPWLSAVLDAARLAVEDENVRTVLGQIQLNDDQGTGIHIGKDAFELVAKLLAANFAADGFDPNYTRTLLDDVIVSRITDETSKAKVDAMLDLLLLVADPDAPVFLQVQSAMKCVNEADSEAAIPGMIYDWLTIPELSVDTFIDDLSSSTGGDGASDLRLALIDLMTSLEPSPDVARDTVAVLAKLIDADADIVVVDGLLDLRGRGVVAELAHLKDAIAQCHPDQFAP